MELKLKKNHTMVKNLGQVHEFDIVIGSSSSLSTTSSESSSSSSSSLESDSFEEVTSSPPSSSSSSSSIQLAHDDPLSDMSSLIQQLPIKRRGLSRHYQGKSQSFTSLANVRSLEDLGKPENPYNNKKLKCSRSFGGGLDETYGASVVSIRHVPIIKKRMNIHSRGSCSSLLSSRRGTSGNNNSFMGGNRPPIPPHRSTSTSTIPNQTVLFA